MNVSGSYLEPVRGAGIQFADDGSRPVERDLNAVSRQVGPLAVPVQLNVVGIGPGHIVPLQVHAPDEDRSPDRLIRSVQSAALVGAGRHRSRGRVDQQHIGYLTVPKPLVSLEQRQRTLHGAH